ncbi:FkbM family methyltransferase [Clostridium sp.]|uniref:FkbM family methyltransferase n=1 Tax=Clostridium sp. TaxID=1506 RepID=UPI002606C4E4|nr:FkbM family methyltransferase [Clostridium sp.]
MVDYKQEIAKYLDSKSNDKYLELIKNKISKFKYICIFPMGIEGMSMFDKLKCQGINVDFFCDNNPKKVDTLYKGIKCIPLDELHKKKDDTVVIISSLYYKEIYKQLSEKGFKHLDRILANKFEIDEYFLKNNIDDIKKSIFKLIDILDDEESKRIVCKIIEGWFLKEYQYGFFDDIYIKNQYFTNEVVKLSDEEVFVDVGPFTGDTVEEFLKNVDYKFSRMFLFELNKSIYEELKENISEYSKEIIEKIITYNYGLSSKEENITYSDGNSGSSIMENGELCGKVIDLDTILQGEKVTFIKMDIEGAEFDALHGAQKTIEKFRPKLAICIYHSTEDLWRIPLYIKKLLPEYKIYIRHHTDLLYETVCYAIPN